MSSENKDNIKYVFNVLTGNFDIVSEFNSSRIVTHNTNPIDNPFQLFDPISGVYFALDAQIVTDENGNVVMV